MNERINFPFNSLLEERKRMFCELYTSLIIHREMSSYHDMLNTIGNPHLLIENGGVTLHAINRCVDAIENFYSHRGIIFLIDSVIDSVVGSFKEENFDFFASSMPQYRDVIAKYRFDNASVQFIDRMLRSKLQGFKMVCSDLDNIYKNIHDSFCQIYFDSTNYKSKKNEKKGVGVVGPVVFSWGGAPMGDALADSVVDRKKQEQLVNSCMSYILEYLRRVELFHRSVMNSFYDVYQVFSDISDRFNGLELALYHDLSNIDKNIDMIFSNYYATEIEMMNETYHLKISEDHNITFREMIESVSEMMPLYNRFGDVA